MRCRELDIEVEQDDDGIRVTVLDDGMPVWGAFAASREDLRLAFQQAGELALFDELVCSGLV